MHGTFRCGVRMTGVIRRYEHGNVGAANRMSKLRLYHGVTQLTASLLPRPLLLTPSFCCRFGCLPCW